MALSPNGKLLATGSLDKTARVWDAANGKEFLTLRGHLDGVTALAFSPDGGRLATVSYDATARVWDAANGQELLTLRGHSGWVFGVAYSPDGQHLATIDDAELLIYTLNVGELLKLARSRVTRDLTSDECLRYFRSKTCPPLPQ